MGRTFLGRRTGGAAIAEGEEPPPTCPADWCLDGDPAVAQAKARRFERSALRVQDLRLSDLTLRWAAELPKRAKPVALLRAYPRIANRLALCWNDPDLSVIVLIKLLSDERGGRRGFPQLVRLELRSLYAHAAQRRSIEMALVEGRASSLS